jgi:hypothetical protein
MAPVLLKIIEAVAGAASFITTLPELLPDRNWASCCAANLSSVEGFDAKPMVKPFTDICP